MLVKEGEYLFLEGDKASSLVIVKSGMLVGTSKQFRKSKFQNFGPSQPHQKAVISMPNSFVTAFTSSAFSPVQYWGSQLTSWQCRKPWAAASAKL